MNNNNIIRFIIVNNKKFILSKINCINCSTSQLIMKYSSSSSSSSSSPLSKSLTSPTSSLASYQLLIKNFHINSNDLIINNNKFDIMLNHHQSSSLLFDRINKRNMCSLNTTSNTNITNNETITIIINLSISFSNGYFSIRFAQRECLLHFWSPIELVIKMLHEELLSSSTTTAIYCKNIGSKLLNNNQNTNDFLDQLFIEFDIDHHHQQPLPFSKFDNLKFGRIEMIAEHFDDDNDDDYDNINSSSNSGNSSSNSGNSSSSTDSETNIIESSHLHYHHQTSIPSISSTSIQSKKNRYRLAKLMPFGYSLIGCNLNEIYFFCNGTGIINKTTNTTTNNDEYKLLIKFLLIDKTLKLKTELEQWHYQNPLDTQIMLFKKMKKIDPNLFEQNELVFLQQEHQLLLERFKPLQQEFIDIIDSARKESRRRFKFGGLFLLSAQLGFVGRLTYFEYSWDIMEPVTWIMTYTTMIGSFAYYIITSEEYVVPGVEKRMIASKFWKLAKNRQFDVKQYKQLKDEIKQLEKRINKLRAGF